MPGLFLLIKRQVLFPNLFLYFSWSNFVYARIFADGFRSFGSRSLNPVHTAGVSRVASLSIWSPQALLHCGTNDTGTSIVRLC